MEMVDKVLRLIGERRPKMSQQRLEETARLAKGRVSRWKKGEGFPTIEEALAVANVLAVPVDWLIDDAREWPAPPRGHDELSRDEEMVLDVFRALGMTRHEAIRRLSGGKPGHVKLSNGTAND